MDHLLISILSFYQDSMIRQMLALASDQFFKEQVIYLNVALNFEVLFKLIFKDFWYSSRIISPFKHFVYLDLPFYLYYLKRIEYQLFLEVSFFLIGMEIWYHSLFAYLYASPNSSRVLATSFLYNQLHGCKDNNQATLKASYFFVPSLQ